MPITPNMLLDLPTLQDDEGVWDDKLNAALDLVDAHDHTTDKGKRITPPAISMTADLDYSVSGTGRSAKNVASVDFQTQAASYMTGRVKGLFVNSADSELYWRTAAGVNVKLTSGTSINVSFVGGIYGDYAATTAKVYYEDAGKRFKFLQDGPAPDFWASVDCGDLKLYEKASAIVNAVTHKSPAALAAGYSITWPPAVPGAAALLQSSTAGVLSFNATGGRVAAFFTTLDANGAANFSAAAVFSSTVTLGSAVAAFTATGAITATDFKHTTGQILMLPAGLWAIPNGSTARLGATGALLELLAHAGATTTPSAVIGIPLKNGDTISAVSVGIDKLSGAGTVNLRVKSFNVSSGTTTTIGTQAWAAGQSITVSGLAVAYSTGTPVWAQIEGGGTTGDLVYDLRVTYTR